MDNKLIEARLRFSLLLTGGIAIVAILAYFIWFAGVVRLPASKVASTWGEFGDFIGGVMNPLVAACALYWLTMSVRLQKQELSDTRSELAKASSAQKDQAQMALLGVQLNSLSIQLDAITTELGYIQERLRYVLQRQDSYSGPGYPIVFDIEAGTNVRTNTLIGVLADRIDFLQKQQKTLLTSLSAIQKLALAKQSETVVATEPA